MLLFSSYRVCIWGSEPLTILPLTTTQHLVKLREEQKEEINGDLMEAFEKQKKVGGSGAEGMSPR